MPGELSASMVPQIRQMGRVKQDPAPIRFGLRRFSAFGLTRATEAPGPAATSSAAAAAPATSPAASAAAASAAATSAPAAPGNLLAELRLCSIFFVKDVKRRQADVRNFLVTEKDFVIRGGVLWRDIRRGSAGGRGRAAR
jgi:hypothetical protein